GDRFYSPRPPDRFVVRVNIGSVYFEIQGTLELELTSSRAGLLVRRGGVFFFLLLLLHFLVDQPKVDRLAAAVVRTDRTIRAGGGAIRLRRWRRRGRGGKGSRRLVA